MYNSIFLIIIVFLSILATFVKVTLHCTLLISWLIQWLRFKVWVELQFLSAECSRNMSYPDSKHRSSPEMLIFKMAKFLYYSVDVIWYQGFCRSCNAGSEQIQDYIYISVVLQEVQLASIFLIQKESIHRGNLQQMDQLLVPPWGFPGGIVGLSHCILFVDGAHLRVVVNNGIRSVWLVLSRYIIFDEHPLMANSSLQHRTFVLPFMMMMSSMMAFTNRFC